MTVTRVSFLFQMNTEPQNPAAAMSHAAGWSEGWWANLQLPSSHEFLRRYAEKRATLLPSQAAIIGFRLAYYDISGNALLPKGTQTGKFRYVGASTLHCDLPQVALELNASTQGGPNTTRFVLRGMPDDVMKRGEYDPPRAFSTRMNAFMEFLVSASANLGWIGRNIGATTVRINSITDAGLVTTDGDAGGTPGVSWLRILRCRDTQGANVSAAYRILTHPTATTYTIAGWEGQTVEASGLARIDTVQFFDVNGVKIGRAIVRKVGRPFESYRGRASKRTV